MVDRRQVLVGAAAAAALTEEAVAQTAPQAAAAPEAPYAISYIEVEPAQADAARRLLARYRDALNDKALKDGRALEFAAFEQIGRPNHFAIVEQWPSARAREDNALSDANREFRTSLAPLLIAPYDERPHFSLSSGALSAGSKAATPARAALRHHPRRPRAAEAGGRRCRGPQDHRGQSRHGRQHPLRCAGAGEPAEPPDPGRGLDGRAGPGGAQRRRLRPGRFVPHSGRSAAPCTTSGSTCR